MTNPIHRRMAMEMGMVKENDNKFPPPSKTRPYFISPNDTESIKKWGAPRPRPKSDYFPSKKEYES